jgi:copper chaperone CopZ
MNIESTKIDLAKQLFNINEESVLMQIKSILDKEEIVAYTTDGKPLSRKAYIEAVKEAENDVENGQYITQSQLLDNIKKW